MTIATLGEALSAGSYDDLAAAVEERGAFHGEAALLQEPREILDGLLASDDGELERVARRGAATNELVLGRSTPEGALVLLLALRGLAEGARVRGAELWYGWSL